MTTIQTISPSSCDSLRADTGQFRRKLLGGLIEDCYSFKGKNTDFLREGTLLARRTRRQVKDIILAYLRKIGFLRVLPEEIKQASAHLEWVLQNLASLESVHDLLGDEYSRNMLVHLMRFRMLGSQRVQLPLSSDPYWRTRDTLDKDYLVQHDTMRCERFSLNRYALPGRHHRMELHCHPLGVLNTFLLEQYSYNVGSQKVEALPGETVIDAGGCWGDTALYFADRVGPKGKVFCFEILEENLRVLRQNLELNRHCAESIEVVRKALWHTSNEWLSLCGSGPGTSIAKAKPQSTGLQVPTLSIDDFVAEVRLDRLDYIKMDIEGAELMALQGAEKALRRFRPKLGISIYHNFDDIFTIPLYLKSLDLGYEFFLDHFTIHREETVLFALPSSLE